MNLGCGTLIVLLLLVAIAGKLIPHGTAPLPVMASARGEHTTKAQGNATSGQRVQSEKVARPLDSPVPATWKDAFESSLSELKDWIDEQAKVAEQNVVDRAALPAGAGPAAEVLAKMGEEARTLVTQHVTDAASPVAVPSHEVVPEKTASKSSHAKPPPSRTNAPVASGPKLAVEGKDPVFNNPWNHAVEPVERYLKQHVHDAGSIEVMDWGQVEVTREGYQVRCVYKSKNVLGKMTTQSRLFVLDHVGKVIDIRD